MQAEQAVPGRLAFEIQIPASVFQTSAYALRASAFTTIRRTGRWTSRFGGRVGGQAATADKAVEMGIIVILCW